jgi:sugar lactone lactonase YvrE
VGSTSGVVTCLSNGTSLISYTFNGGTVTAIVTVDVLTLTPITGPGGLCMDSTAGFSNNTPGGVWRSGSPIATIDNYGVVSGVSMGYVNISYTFTDLNSCSISVTKTINVTGHPLYLYTDAGNGTGTSLGDGGPAANATIGAPRAMCADTAGNVYICDVTANRVRKLDIYGFMTTVAGNGKTGNPVNGMAATATSLSMSGGGGVYVDNTGNIYISNTTGQTVSKVTASTGIISTICGTGIAGYSGDGGLASAAKVQTPLGICGDSSGNLYFADASNERIRKIDTKGIITTIIGTGSDAYSGDGGPGTSARVSVPRDLAMDIFGNMYIADFGNYVVRKYVMATGIISTFAGNGLIGVTGDGGPATAATMNTPARLAYDGGNMLYIADQNNNKVRGVNLTTGIINTVVATGKSGFGGDGGPSVLGQLYSIGGIAFNRLGNLYMSDINNKRIRVSPYNGSILITQSGPTSVEVGTSVTFTAHASLVTDISFQWQLGGIDIQGATSSTYTVNIPTSGSYSCILTVFPDCGDVFTSASNNLVINAYGFHNYHTGFIDPQISEGVQVYPNPVHGTLKISGSGIADGDVKISVYDLMGRSILSKSGLVTNGNLEEQVDMQSLAGGVYLISIIDYSGKTRVFKCVKD